MVFTLRIKKVGPRIQKYIYSHFLGQDSVLGMWIDLGISLEFQLWNPQKQKELRRKKGFLYAKSCKETRLWTLDDLEKTDYHMKTITYIDGKSRHKITKITVCLCIVGSL